MKTFNKNEDNIHVDERISGKLNGKERASRIWKQNLISNFISLKVRKIDINEKYISKVE